MGDFMAVRAQQLKVAELIVATVSIFVMNLQDTGVFIITAIFAGSASATFHHLGYGADTARTSPTTMITPFAPWFVDPLLFQPATYCVGGTVQFLLDLPSAESGFP